jgi:tartronate-semialdehyde synthase
LGWDVPAAIGAKLADPDAEVVAVVRRLLVQFLIAELAVGAEYDVPFVVVLLNNSYLGLIREAERAYDMDFEVRLSFKNVNCPEIGEYGVDHVRAAEAFGCIAARVLKPEDLASTLQRARKESIERRPPAVVEVILDRATNIAMGPEIDKITEFEETLDLPAEMSLEPEELLADEE